MYGGSVATALLGVYRDRHIKRGEAAVKAAARRLAGLNPSPFWLFSVGCPSGCPSGCPVFRQARIRQVGRERQSRRQEPQHVTLQRMSLDEYVLINEKGWVVVANVTGSSGHKRNWKAFWLR